MTFRTTIGGKSPFPIIEDFRTDPRTAWRPAKPAHNPGADMACDCVDQMNAKLAEHNTKIIETFGFPRDGSPVYMRPKIDVEKIETRKRVGPALAIPSYCPLCGTKYEAAA